jgi:coenzyme F420 hydrogenase subunit beta
MFPNINNGTIPGMSTLSKTNLHPLAQTVIAGGYCIGCGACASVYNSPARMFMNTVGCYQAKIEMTDNYNDDISAVCPFSENSQSEDTIAEKLYGELPYVDGVGRYLNTYGGHVNEGVFRENGSSGGFGTWIVNELFQQKLIDGVIHIRSSVTQHSVLFEYGISHRLEDIQAGAKSRYYPVEMSQVLQQIRETPGRYAIVGVPCFIKAVRLLMVQDSVLKSRIHFCIGLVCGHLKSKHFASMFAWQVGIHPDDLRAINFRHKLTGRTANDYGIEVKGIKNGQEACITRPKSYFYGDDWGKGFFKYEACDYCDDVLAETADVTVGDAWLPEYLNDSNGTNILITRHPVIQHLLMDAQMEGRIHLDNLTPEQIRLSQKAGLRHRRDGLAYRLHLKQKKGEWTPPKRVHADAEHLDERYRNIYEQRIVMAQQSHHAFQKALDSKNFHDFVTYLHPIVTRYEALYQPIWRRIASRIKKWLYFWR